MGVFKSFLTRFAIDLFSLLFIYPAIVFAMLVLGFTSSWKSGTLMLVSALLLRFVLKREAAAARTAVRQTRGKSSGRTLNPFPGIYDDQASPPQLSDIYYDMAAHMREQEALLAMIREQEEREDRQHEQQDRRDRQAMQMRQAGKKPAAGVSGHPSGCRCPSCSRAMH
jgi:hypothetical protein